MSAFDVAGREIAVLADGVLAPGRYSRIWDGSSAGGAVPAGLYLVRLRTPERTLVRKLARAEPPTHREGRTHFDRPRVRRPPGLTRHPRVKPSQNEAQYVRLGRTVSIPTGPKCGSAC